MRKIISWFEHNPRIPGLIIFAGILLCIGLNSFMSYNGYLSPDSTNYLRLAKSFDEGRGLFIDNPYLEVSSTPKYFARWPMGYPVLITSVAQLTNNIFIASKLVNLLCIALLIFLLYKMYGRNFWLFGFILWMATFLEVFSFSWSEVPFMVSSLFVVYSSSKIFSPGASPPKWLIFAGIGIIASFLFRYIGVYHLLFLGLLRLFDLVKRKRIRFGLWLTLAICAIIIAGYLGINYHYTGFIGGYNRPLTNINFLTYLQEIALGHLHEINLLLARKFARPFILIATVIVQLIIIFFFLRKSYPERKVKAPAYNKYLFLNGCIYWFMIIGMRFRYDIDSLNYRLLAPALILVIFSAIDYIQQQKPAYLPATQRIIIILAILSYAINVPAKWIYNLTLEEDYKGTYHEQIVQLKQEASQIKKPAAVVFGNPHLRYLSLDFYVYKPHLPNGLKQTKLQDLKDIFGAYEGNVYFAVPDTGRLSSLNPHPTVLQFMQEHADEDYVRIK